MNKYIDSEKLIAEIERRKNNNIISAKKCPTGYFSLVANEDIEILDFITSLQQEQPVVDLEKEIERGWEELEKDYSPSALDKSYMIVSGLIGEKQFSRIARHFAEWGAIHLNARKEE